MAGLDLGKQVGPLPLGGWIVVVAGGLGIGYLINRNMAKAPVEEPDSTQLTESGTGGGGGQFIYDPPSSSSTEKPPETNQSWGLKVTNWLLAQNHNPTVADNAVRKYLTGLPLSVPENALINLALIQFGAAPESLPPVEQPDTPPAQATPPKAVVYLHVNRATRRNDVVWDDSSDPGDAVTRYVVKATALETGKSIGATIPAIPGVETYTWDHHAWPGATKAYTYKYVVTPYAGTVAGASATVTAKHIM